MTPVLGEHSLTVIVSAQLTLTSYCLTAVVVDCLNKVDQLIVAFHQFLHMLALPSFQTPNLLSLERYPFKCFRLSVLFNTIRNNLC